MSDELKAYVIDRGNLKQCIGQFIKAVLERLAYLNLPMPSEFFDMKSAEPRTVDDLDTRAVYDRLCRLDIAGLDIAGLAEKYLFRAPSVSTVVEAIDNGNMVKIVDVTTGGTLLSINPQNFFSMTCSNRKARKKCLLPSFTKFPELPAEMRHRIWALAAEPRYLLGSEVSTVVFSLALEWLVFSCCPSVPT